MSWSHEGLVDDLRTKYLQDPGIGRDRRVREAARQLRVLPLLELWGGFVGLRSDGELLCVDEGPPMRAVPLAESDWRPGPAAIRHLALASGIARFPELAFMRPERTPDAISCWECDGHGRMNIGGKPAPLEILCACGGLGWLPAPKITTASGEGAGRVSSGHCENGVANERGERCAGRAQGAPHSPWRRALHFLGILNGRRMAELRIDAEDEDVLAFLQDALKAGRLTEGVSLSGNPGRFEVTLKAWQYSRQPNPFIEFVRVRPVGRGVVLVGTVVAPDPMLAITVAGFAMILTVIFVFSLVAGPWWFLIVVPVMAALAAVFVHVAAWEGARTTVGNFERAIRNAGFDVRDELNA